MAVLNDVFYVANAQYFGCFAGCPLTTLANRLQQVGIKWDGK